MLYFVEMLRALATALIFNSHCDKLYPINIAIGGEYGLALFFLLTGFLSSKIDKGTQFISFFTKRFLRLFIPATIWSIILVLLTIIEIGSVWDVFSVFVYPTPRWYISFMPILYVFIYFFARFVFPGNTAPERKRIIALILALTIVYIVIFCFTDNTVPHNSTFSWHTRILWVICALAGLLIRKANLCEKAVKHRSLLFIAFVGFLFVYGGYKICYHYRILLEIQCICLIAPIISATCLLLYLGSLENKIRGMMNKALVSSIVECFSKNSLEIFITQFFFISLFEKTFFPLNAFLALSCSIICGKILHIFTGYVMEFGGKNKS